MPTLFVIPVVQVLGWGVRRPQGFTWQQGSSQEKYPVVVECGAAMIIGARGPERLGNQYGPPVRGDRLWSSHGPRTL